MKIHSVLTEILKFLFSFDPSIGSIVHHPTSRVGQCYFHPQMSKTFPLEGVHWPTSRVGQCCFDPMMSKKYFWEGGGTLPNIQSCPMLFWSKNEPKIFWRAGVHYPMYRVAQCSFDPKMSKNIFRGVHCPHPKLANVASIKK